VGPIGLADVEQFCVRAIHQRVEAPGRHLLAGAISPSHQASFRAPVLAQPSDMLAILAP
jgi:hypothetical protein